MPAPPLPPPPPRPVTLCLRAEPELDPEPVVLFRAATAPGLHCAGGAEEAARLGGATTTSPKGSMSPSSSLSPAAGRTSHLEGRGAVAAAAGAGALSAESDADTEEDASDADAGEECMESALALGGRAAGRLVEKSSTRGLERSAGDMSADGAACARPLRLSSSAPPSSSDSSGTFERARFGREAVGGLGIPPAGGARTASAACASPVGSDGAASAAAAEATSSAAAMEATFARLIAAPRASNADKAATSGELVSCSARLRARRAGTPGAAAAAAREASVPGAAEPAAWACPSGCGGRICRMARVRDATDAPLNPAPPPPPLLCPLRLPPPPLCAGVRSADDEAGEGVAAMHTSGECVLAPAPENIDATAGIAAAGGAVTRNENGTAPSALGGVGARGLVGVAKSLRALRVLRGTDAAAARGATVATEAPDPGRTGVSSMRMSCSPAAARAGVRSKPPPPPPLRERVAGEGAPAAAAAGGDANALVRRALLRSGVEPLADTEGAVAARSLPAGASMSSFLFFALALALEGARAPSLARFLPRPPPDLTALPGKREGVRWSCVRLSGERRGERRVLLFLLLVLLLLAAAAAAPTLAVAPAATLVGLFLLLMCTVVWLMMRGAVMWLKLWQRRLRPRWR